ncbi:unnamed protein product [Anisakis simplex]|uniref:Ubiquitin-like domain-containing protein n=1 Tax=Anisakis simplex TaxID=6269 RepID=A0A0M3K052_ANISI|nr:unnamed protein product [Anisakis simplex]
MKVIVENNEITPPSFFTDLIQGDEAKLRSLGIKEGSVLKVIFLPVVDFQSPIASAIRNILGRDCPTATLATFIVHFKYILSRIVNEDLSLDDLERYAEVRNKSAETSSLSSMYSLDEHVSSYSVDGSTMAYATDNSASRGEDLQDYFMYADD